MDIRSTLANVCRKVTHDHSVSEAVRLERCKALKILGKIFMKHGGTLEAGLGDIRNKLASQMNEKQTHHADEKDQPIYENE